MAEKRFYWMKFQRDFFKSLRIKKLRRLAGGDTFTIIYLKIQLLSIVTEGYLQYKHIFDSFAEELAEEIDEDVENIQVTLSYLLQTKLMLQDGDTYFLPYAAENIGSECGSAKRVRDYRERQEALQCNTDVTEVKRLCNVEKEIEREKEIEINILSDKQKKQLADNMTPITLDVVTYLNEKANTNFKPCTDKTKRCIKARVNEGFTLDDFKKVIDKKVNKWMGTEFQQYLRPETLFGTKFEGYLNAKEVKPKGNKFNQMIKSNYDFDAIEKEILQ